MNKSILSLALTSLLAASAQAADTNASCSLEPMSSIPMGKRTAAVIAADLNNDSQLDIVGTNQEGPSISVALAKGKGAFNSASDYSTTSGPYETSSADFNGDGFLDLASANFGAASGAPHGTTVSVHINKGNGQFNEKADFTVTDGEDVKVRAITTADFNGDGKADIAAAIQRSGLGILLGKGDGSFETYQLFPAGGSEHGVVASDFNQDGTMDVAVVNNGRNGTVEILFGKGDGSFLPKVTYSAGSGAFGLDKGDLNGDGYDDIATANTYGGSITVLINRGAKEPGVFDRFDYEATPKPVAITMADLNGDGLVDVLSSENSGAVTDLYLNAGNGQLKAAIPLATGRGSYDSFVADFDKDGKMDLAVALIEQKVDLFKVNCK